MTQALKGKLALVTGASRGIGAAIAARLARDGASVIIHYASSAARAEAVVKEIRDAGGEAEAVGANLSQPEGVKSLIGSLNGAFGGRFEGRLDILVNNAGTVEYGPFLDSSEHVVRHALQPECSRADRTGKRRGSAHGRGRLGTHHQRGLGLSAKPRPCLA